MRRNGPDPVGRRFLREAWECCATPAGQCADPAALPPTLSWVPATVPGTAAEALRAAGLWSLDAAERRFDAEDWWFRTRFEVPEGLDPGRCHLGFEGLATLCDVWLNGQRILRSDNMFLAHRVPAASLVAGTNILVLQFRSLDAALKQKRPRPRWRAPMVENQQLRWHRTTLLGRTPGWSPPAAAVGPWKPVWLDLDLDAATPEVQLLRGTLAGTSGQVLLRIAAPRDAGTVTATLLLRAAGQTLASAGLRAAGTDTLEAELVLPDVEPWWPHTHGQPRRYEAVLQLRRDGRVDEYALGHIGFRSVGSAGDAADDLRIRVNGTDIFCRGACWTPLDSVALRADEAAYRRALQQVVDTGFNMLRLSGAMLYEDELFLDLCDEYGLLVWQDFMFANLDYPADDAGFAASVDAEARQQLQRWARHPCVAVICGNSEVSQQAAMWGAPRALWSPELFEQRLQALAASLCPGVPYWPSSAFGGDLPHLPAAGTTSYYGVGAYLRGFDDLRRSGLRFTTECLAFANVPEPEAIDAMPGGAGLRVHHALWKRRAPRDLGAGWDFEDVRDHYLKLLFDLDPMQLRYADHARYLEMSRVAVAEVMTTAFTEWRRAGSACHGALIWFLRDLWPGAGWGIVGAQGEAKSPLYALRRVLQPQWVGICDEGLNGLSLHLGNERAAALPAQLELALYRQGRHLITRATRDLVLAPRSCTAISAASLLDEFHDLTHAYRFGPLSCDLVVATLRDAAGRQLSRAIHLPATQRHAAPDAGCVLEAIAQPLEQDGRYRLLLRSTGFARAVHVDAPGFGCEDQYFALLPDEEHVVVLQAARPGTALFGSVTALNAAAPARIQIQR